MRHGSLSKMGRLAPKLILWCHRTGLAALRAHHAEATRHYLCLLLGASKQAGASGQVTRVGRWAVSFYIRLKAQLTRPQPAVQQQALLCFLAHASMHESPMTPDL